MADCQRARLQYLAAARISGPLDFYGHTKQRFGSLQVDSKLCDFVRLQAGLIRDRLRIERFTCAVAVMLAVYGVSALTKDRFQQFAVASEDVLVRNGYTLSNGFAEPRCRGQ